MFAASKTASLSGYQIQRSLRFNSADSTHLSRTYSVSSTDLKRQTFSFWMKRTSFTTAGVLITGYDGSSGSSNYIGFLSSTGTTILRLVFAGGDIYTTQVFRDPSAWYHIVVVLDTTQATDTNRLKLYVNGVQVTSFTVSAWPTLNGTSQFSLTNSNNKVGSAWTGSSEFYDGYMTEVNFIDGQALTPSSFGQTNANTGVWEPKPYAGSYGTNGFYLNFSDNSNTTATTLGKDYSRGTNLLTYSEQFDNAAWTKTNSSVTANTVVSPDGTLDADKVVESTANGAHDVRRTGISASASTAYTQSVYVKAAERTKGELQMFGNSGGSTVTFDLVAGTATASGAYGGWASASAAITNVGNGWYRVTHTVTTNAGLTAFTATFGMQNAAGTGSYTGDGYSGIYIWGAQLEPGSSAGAYTQTTAGTAPNNWTPNNFSVSAGAGNDSLVDVPTAWGTDTGVGGTVRGNYATLNPINKGTNATITNGNLDYTSNSSIGDTRVYSTIGMSSGKWYCEYVPTAGATNLPVVGIALSTESPNSGYVGATSGSYGYYANNGAKLNNNGSTAYGSSYGLNDIIGIAFDADAGTMTYYKNGVSQGVAFTNIPVGTYFFAEGDYTGSYSATFNFGQRPFAYTAPSGFKALCTQNLPTPTIGATAATQAGKFFNAVTYTAPVNSGTLTVTGVGFQPDFTWWKSRSNTDSNLLMNVLSGSDKYLLSNATNAEATYSGVWTATSDGFTASALSYSSNQPYVAWNWKANGAGVTNTAGSITSTVSANTTSGFSIVTYTGSGAAATIGHGLGAAPKMIIVKSRDQGTTGYTGNWYVYHASNTAAPETDYLLLNSTAATADDTFWNDTAPTSTVFSVGALSGTNDSGDKFVAYCFAEVQGFSKAFSYTGNGSSDGPFVYCGFRPAYLLVKRTDTTSNWTVLDFKRIGYNVDNNPLYPNLSDAEGTTDLADLLSNGFKMRSTDASVNASGGTYIFMAFAEAPQKFALAR